VGRPGKEAVAAAVVEVGRGEGGGDGADGAAIVLSGIPCVFSSELTRARLLPLPMNAEAGEKPQDFGALERFRVRVIPVLGTSAAQSPACASTPEACSCSWRAGGPGAAASLPMDSLTELLWPIT
jgi:hypothetical protein